ncbi:MAG TPA: OmpA family protein [Vicinamibacterales bacterium]|jgi:outer membrane protein OmpA-like peptidoglycan-associated protein
MRRSTSLAVLVAIAAAGATAACSSLRLSHRHQPESVVVLLRDETGSVGKASVANKKGDVMLDDEREATRVNGKKPPSKPSPMNEAEVREMFGDALSAMPGGPLRFTLNFKFESDELTDEARAIVPQIVKLVAQRPVPDVVVVGHTDTMGTPAANYELGMKRAMTVRALLVDAGLDPALIEVSSLGETDLLVKTPDETPEPRNRRVDITVR